MNIAINAKNLSTEALAGPELYILNLIGALSKIDSANSYTIFTAEGVNENAQEVLENLPENFSIKKLPNLVSWTQVSLALELWKGGYDVLFSAIHTIPVLAVPKVKMVSMIHGLEFRTNQAETSPFGRLSLGKAERLTCLLSDKLIVPSQATRDAILNTGWRLGNNDVSIVKEGLRENLEKTSPELAEKTLAKLNIPSDPYLIFISTIQPRKNLKSIVEALAIMREKYGKRINLIVCGKKGWNCEEEVGAPEKFNVANQVFFPGRISDENLSALLSGAEAYISASLDEGFGLPLLEAMALEVPTIVSDIPAYRDLAQKTALYFDPQNPESIAETLEKFLTSPKEEHLRKVEKAKELSEAYTWEETARRVLGEIKAVGKSEQ